MYHCIHLCQLSYELYTIYYNCTHLLRWPPFFPFSLSFQLAVPKQAVCPTLPQILASIQGKANSTYVGSWTIRFRKFLQLASVCPKSSTSIFKRNQRNSILTCNITLTNSRLQQVIIQMVHWVPEWFSWGSCCRLRHSTSGWGGKLKWLLWAPKQMVKHTVNNKIQRK